MISSGALPEWGEVMKMVRANIGRFTFRRQEHFVAVSHFRAFATIQCSAMRTTDVSAARNCSAAMKQYSMLHTT